MDIKGPPARPRSQRWLVVLACLTVLMTASTFSLALRLASAERAQETAMAEVMRLSAEASRLTTRVSELEASHRFLQSAQDSPMIFVSDYMAWLANLEAEGLSDPPAQLVSDLIGHPELIPMKAVLGGTMHFYRPMTIADDYVIAPFEDGHISGWGRYSYEVRGGRITWRLLEYGDH